MALSRDEKLDYLARLFMYAAKVGYDADIEDVEYFCRSIAHEMDMNVDNVITSKYVDEDTGALVGSEDEVTGKIRELINIANP